MNNYIRNVLNSWTQALGSLTAYTYNANESVSGASWRKRATKKGGLLYRLINKLFFWQPNHCKEAARREVKDCLQLIAAHEGVTYSLLDGRVVLSIPDEYLSG